VKRDLSDIGNGRAELQQLIALTDNIHRKMLWEWGLVRSLAVPIPGFANLGFYDQNTQQDFEGESPGDFPLPSALEADASYAALKGSQSFYEILARRLLRRSAVKAATAALQADDADVRVSIHYVAGDAPNTGAPNTTQLLQHQWWRAADTRVRDFAYLNMHADAALITLQVVEMWLFIDELVPSLASTSFADENAHAMASRIASATTTLFGSGQLTSCSECDLSVVTGVDFANVCVAPFEKCYALPTETEPRYDQQTEFFAPQQPVLGVRAQCLGKRGMFECRATVDGDLDGRCVFAEGMWLGVTCLPPV
jgi:hypothetical protein